ncbi:protein of unknown function [Agreia sp. COWG]|nr:protein of unknown function [Agreia sp. COWG]
MAAAEGSRRALGVGSGQGPCETQRQAPADVGTEQGDALVALALVEPDGVGLLGPRLQHHAVRPERGRRRLEGPQDGRRHPGSSRLGRHVHALDLHRVRADRGVVERSQASARDSAAVGVSSHEKHGDVGGGGRRARFVVIASIALVQFAALLSPQSFGIGVVVVDGCDLPGHGGPFCDNRYGNRCYG